MTVSTGHDSLNTRRKLQVGDEEYAIYSIDAAEEAGVKDFLGLQITGNTDDLKQQLEELLSDIQVDELMFTVDIYEPAKRRQALDILAQTRTSTD